MKKFISFLSIFAIICTLFTNIAIADEYNKFYCEESVNGTDVTLTFYVTTNKELSQTSGALDLAGAYAACDEIVFQQIDYVFNVNSSLKVMSWSVLNTDGSTFTGSATLGTITFKNVKSAFTLSQRRAFTAKDGSKASVVDSFTNTQVDYTVNVPSTTKVATEGDSYNGRSTFYGTATDIPSGTSTITAEMTKGSETKTDTIDIPDGIWGGKTKILPIVSYDPAEVTSGVFTLILKNGTTEFGKWTYTVE